MNDPAALKVTAGLVLAGLLLYGASFNDPFHFDDALILKDSNVTNPGRWHHFFNPLHLRQLTFFTFYWNHLIAGDSPVGFHVVNVALHIANAVLLFFLLNRFAGRWVAIVSAAIFLAHPLQTEPALYVYQRSVLLACLFSLLGLLALLEKRYVLVAVLFICAFESKESALAVPLAVAVFYDRWRSPGEALAPVIARRFQILLLVLVAALGVVTLGLLVYRGETTVGIGAMEHTTPLGYFLAQTRVVYTYFRLLVFPVAQSLEYEVRVGMPIPQILGLTALIAAAWWMSGHTRWKVLGLSALAFFILLAPTSSFIPSSDVAFEHRLYLPMLAFSLFAASILARFPHRGLIAGIVVCVLGILTIQRGSVWSSEIALWEDTSKQAPGKARVWFNLGGAYLNVDPVKAAAAFRRALNLQPHFPEAFYNLGVIEQGKGNYREAFGHYQRAVEQEPDYWPAWNNMGNVAFSLGERERAVEYLEQTLSLNQEYWPAQYNLAIVHFTNGRFERAVQRLKTVLDWRPEFREARYLFAVSLEKAGYRTAAGEEWKKLGESGSVQPSTPAMLPAPSRP